MNEGDSMDSFLVEIKDLKEQLATVEEIIPDTLLMHTILDGLPDSHHSFASTLRLLMKENLNAIKFKELMVILLQEEQSRKIWSNMSVTDQAFMVGQRAREIHYI